MGKNGDLGECVADGRGIPSGFTLYLLSAHYDSTRSLTMHRRYFRNLICLLPCTGLGFLSPAVADTLSVCSSGCDYSDIQSAINDASDGDVIEIAAGTYGSSSDWVETLGKAITIRGEVGVAGEPLTTVAHFFYIWEGETSSTVFENLNCKTQWHIDGSGPTLRNCVFDDVDSNGLELSSGALFIVGSSRPVLENCRFTRNSSLGASGALDEASGFCFYGDSVTLTDCLFDSNSGGKFGGAMIARRGDITLRNCTFTNNGSVNFSKGGALYYSDTTSTGSLTVTDCTFIENRCSQGGGAIYSDDGGTVRNCLFQENYVSDAFPGGAILGSMDIQDSTFCGNRSRYAETEGYDYFNHESSEMGHVSNCYSRHCDDCDGDGVLDGCGSGLGNILLVPATYSTIESALAAACYGDVVEIAAGTYVPAETLDVGLDITLRGAVDSSGRPATIIDCRGVGHVISAGTQAHGGDQEIVLENLMIVDGAVFADESRILLENCVFQANTGRAISSRKSTLTVIDCAFESNAGGGVELKCGQNLFIGCDFADNAAPQGAGVFCTGWVMQYSFDGEMAHSWLGICDDDLAGTTFEACTFASNGPCDEGGGVYVDSLNPIFQNCVFNSGSTERGGAIVVENASPYLENCVFADNEALQNGGALLIRGESLPILRQCDFQNNRVGGSGGAIVIESGNPQIEACVFADNEAQESGGAVFLYGDSLPILRQCDFQNNRAGVGGGAIMIVSANPQIEDCVFADNESLKSGGAIMIVSANPQIEDCVFADNEAQRNGGAVFLRGGSMPILRQCNFNHNHAVEEGGAVAVEDTGSLFTDWFTFSDCRFIANTARFGGALMNRRRAGTYYSVSLEGCTIDDNTAEFGGGVFTGELAGTQLLGSRVRNNRATSGLGGGLEAASFWGWHTVENTEFCGNQPEHIMGDWVDNGGNSFLVMCIDTGPADFNQDGRVDGADMGLLIARWGPCLDEPCAEDINGDGEVNGGDLGILIASWSQ